MDRALPFKRDALIASGFGVRLRVLLFRYYLRAEVWMTNPPIHYYGNASADVLVLEEGIERLQKGRFDA